MPEYVARIKVDPGPSEPAVRGLAGALRDTATEATKTDASLKGMDGTFAGMGKKASESALAVSRSSAAASSAFQSFSKSIDTGGRGAERHLAVLSLRTDELRAAIKAAQATGSPVSQDAINTMSRLERETEKEVKRLGQLREAQGDASRAVNAASASIDGQVRAMGSWRDLLDASNSKAGALALKITALWTAFEIGYSVGAKLRAALNWLTDGAFDRGVQQAAAGLINFVTGVEEGAEAADVFRHNLALLKLHGIDAVGLSADAAAKRVEALRRSLTALEFVRANADVLAGATPDQSRDRQFNMATAYEYWQRVKNSTQEARLAAAQYGADLAAEMRKAGQPVSGHLARMEALVKAHERDKQAVQDAAAAARTAMRQREADAARLSGIIANQARQEALLAQAVKAVSQGADPTRIRALLAAAEKLGAASLWDPLVQRLAASAQHSKLLELSLAAGYDLTKQMADGTDVIAKNLDAAAKSAAKVTIDWKNVKAPDDLGKGGAKKQADEFVKEWDRGWKTYREYGLDAIGATAAGLKDMVIDFAMTGGNNWKQIWEGMARTGLAIILDMFEQMFRRWIAMQSAMAATDYVAKSGSGNTKNVGKGSAAGSAQQAGSAYSSANAAGVSTSTMLGAGLIAYGLYVVYLGFIKDHKEKFARVTIGDAGQIIASAQHGRKYMAGVLAVVEGAVKSLKKWLDDINLEMVKFGQVTIQSDKSGFLVTAMGLSQRYKTGEEAIAAAMAFMVRFGEFADSVPALVQAAVRGTREISLESLGSNIAYARELLTQNMTDVQRAMSDAIEVFSAQMRRSAELFGIGTAAFAEAALSSTTRLVTSLRAQYNALTGTREDPMVEQRRREDAYNLELKLARAQLTLWLADIQARRANYEAGRLIVRGMVELARGSLEIGGLIIKGGGMFLEGVDAIAQAFALAEQAINDALAALPPEIAPGSTKPRRNRGGGGRRQEIQQDRESLASWLDDREFRVATASMGSVQRQLAELNREYDAQRKLAHGDAAALARLNRVREQESELIKKQARESAYAGLTSFEGQDAFARLAADAETQRKVFEDLYKAGAISAIEYADALARVTRAEEDRANVMGRQMYAGILSGIAQYLEEGEQKQKALAAAAQIEYTIKRATWATEIELLYLKRQLTTEEYNFVRGLLGSLPAILPTAAAGNDGTFSRNGNRTRSSGYWEEMARQQQEHARNLAEVNKALRDFKRGLALDELSPLTPVQRLQEAEQQYRATYAAARAGDLDAARRFPQVFQDFFRELRNFGGTDARYLAFWNEGQTFLDQLIAQTGPAAQPLTPGNYPGPTAGQQAQQNAEVLTRLQLVRGATDQVWLVARQIERIGDVQVEVLREIRDGVVTMTTTTGGNVAAGSRFERVA